MTRWAVAYDSDSSGAATSLELVSVSGQWRQRRKGWTDVDTRRGSRCDYVAERAADIPSSIDAKVDQAGWVHQVDRSGHEKWRHLGEHAAFSPQREQNASVEVTQNSVRYHLPIARRQPAVWQLVAGQSGSSSGHCINRYSGGTEKTKRIIIIVH